MKPLLRSHLLGWALVILAGGYFGFFALFPDRLLSVGVNHYGVWFLDSFAILASNDALARGLDPWVPNALDYFNRPHIYSHWWFRLHDFGLTRADNLRVGLGCVALFFVAAFATLRPREPREVLWQLAVLCSSPVLLAVNRANNDLIIFALLAPVVPCLLSPHRAVRFAAIVLIALAAGLKFYPAVGALILLAGGDARELRWRLALAVLGLALVGADVAADLRRIGAYLPKADGIMTFGASNLLEAAGLGASAARLIGLATGALLAIAFTLGNFFPDWDVPAEERGAWWSFLFGAVLLAGCFFTGTNYAYRWVFAIWLTPLLWRLPGDMRAPLVLRRLARATRVLLVLILWIDPVTTVVLTRLAGHVRGDLVMSAADRVFRYEQPLAWAFFICLLGFLAPFVRGGVRTLLERRTVES